MALAEDSTTNNTTAQFTFTFDAEWGSTFECKLDTVVFAGCSSPQPYSDLVEGASTRSPCAPAMPWATATDTTPATRSWKVRR